MLLLVAPAFALDGEPGMHDPSTVIQADGRFYVYATGNGLPAFVSTDGQKRGIHRGTVARYASYTGPKRARVLSSSRCTTNR